MSLNENQPEAHFNVLKNITYTNIMDQLEDIAGRGKRFEAILNIKNPIYNDWVAANNIVKDFIRDRQLIVYGGTAIDMALRLRGDKIYPDESLPVMDLDFMSMDNITTAYELADILYDAGFKEVRAIQASHVQTMRIDIRDNTFIADISYCPESVFRQLKYIVYDSMRIIHPDYQRIDVHHSLTYPFIGPPRESIFNRWEKDIKRYNMLNKYYPIEWSRVDESYMRDHVREIAFDCRRYLKYVLHGPAAYALIYKCYSEMIQKFSAEYTETKDTARSYQPIPAVFEYDSGILKFTTFDNLFVFITHHLKDYARELTEAKIPFRAYHPYMNMISKHIKYSGDGQGVTVQYVAADNTDRMSTIYSVAIDNKTAARITSIQNVLLYYLARAVLAHDVNESALMYNYYIGILAMIRDAEHILGRILAAHSATLADIIPREKEEKPKHPDIDYFTRGPGATFFLSLNTYGSENRSETYKTQLNKIHHDIYGDDIMPKPAPYYVERSRANGVRMKKFNYNSNEFFQEDGDEFTYEL